MRTEFLGLVSHELRAPRIAIKGSADTLLEEAAELDRDEMREFFRIIVDQVNHMRGHIGDLLDAGRIDSGTLSVAPEPSEVAALVERSAKPAPERRGPPRRRRRPAGGAAPRDGRPQAHRTGAQQPLLDRRAPRPRVDPDPRRRRARGGARRRLGLGRGKRGGAQTVAAPVQQAHRGGTGRDGRPRPRARHISKELVEAHGGRIRAESAGAGRGATFTFTLPAAGEAGAPAAPEPRRAAAHPRGGRRPAGAALRPRRALRGRLRPARHGRNAEPAAHHPHREGRGWCCSTWCCARSTASS